MNDSIQYGAEMTFRQFIALTNFLKFHNPIDEIKGNDYFNKLRCAKNIEPDSVKKWIFNGWNTERILRANDNFISIEDNFFALQWSFPQAYYSVFMLTLSYMTLKGQNTTSHAGIMNKFGEFISTGKYPKMISFYCKGTKKNPEYCNIQKHPSHSSLEFDHSSKDSCETQICQFLKATREILLDEKRNDQNVAKKFVAGKGKNKHTKISLSETDWQSIAKDIGVTNILHLLYRKRIKSNYRDIDSFTYENLKADYIHKSLIGIVKTLNLIHEAYIYKIIGSKKYLDYYSEYTKRMELPFLDKRIEKLNNEI